MKTVNYLTSTNSQKDLYAKTIKEDGEHYIIELAGYLNKFFNVVKSEGQLKLRKCDVLSIFDAERFIQNKLK